MADANGLDGDGHAWLQQELVGCRASVLAGLYDLNSEFDVLESSTLFVNSSHGVDPTLSQSGTLGPSIFPHTALGVRAMFRPVAHLYGRLLVADAMAGNPSVSGETRVHLAAGDGALVVAELGTLASTGAGTSSNPHHFSTYRLGRLGGDEAAGKLALGVWHYTRRAARLEASAGAHEVRGRPGLYLIGEHVLGGLPGGARPSVFLRLGAADPRIYRFAGFVGTGVSTSGTFASRPQDAAGIALAVAINGDPYLRTERRAGRPVARAELNLEVTYAAELMRGLVAQADVQYVAHPDTDLRRSAAFVGGLRLELSL